MGMYAYAHQVTSDRLDSFRRDPDRVAPFLRKVLRSLANGGDFSDPRWTLDLHKYWAILQYLLAGSPSGPAAAPRTDPILGGVEIGDDMNYGPARFLTAQQVREIALQLGRLSWETISLRFDPEAMRSAGVYLAEADGVPDGARTVFHMLVNFYSDAASQNNAILLVVL
jgi:hypothetical protein